MADAKKEVKDGEKKAPLNGIKILAELAALKLSVILQGRLDEKAVKSFGFILSKDVSAKDVSKAEYEALVKADGVDSELGRRLLNLCANCRSDVALTLVELIMLRVCVPEVGQLYELISSGNEDGVTLLTAARVCGYLGTVDEAVQEMRQADVTARFLLECKLPEKGDFYLNVYHADIYLLSFLTGGDARDLPYEEFNERFDLTEEEPVCFGMKEEVEGLFSQMENLLLSSEDPEPFTVLVSGEKESGRYTAIKSVSRKLSLTLLSVDFESLLGRKDPKEAMRYAVRSCALEGRALCVRNIKKHEDTEFLIQRLRAAYREFCVLPLILLTEKDVKLSPILNERFISMKIPENAKAATELWEGFLPEGYRELAGSLSSKMKLNAGQMKKVCTGIDTILESGQTVDEHVIIRLCYAILDDGRYDNVKWVEPGFSMDDLKIEPHNRAILEDVVKQVELRSLVYENWGLKSRYAYGRCVSVILAGPPGTGKTMSVHALANRLGLELYKVDLSQIVDKYVGETEKRLEEVFTRAQKCNMILFFDEADAVMGKRSEVKDAQDKYANTEISFILQRIEEFDGIVILATNNLQNIDHAFMRRIRYVLNFQLPDVKTRQEIWRGAFGSGVLLSDDIDFDYLAERFEFSGGEIKNVVLNAVFYGAADGGKVEMKHIMKAIYRELTKARRVALSEDYGKYGYLLTD